MKAFVESNQVKAFFHTGRLAQYPKNQIILRPGELPQGVSLIEDGLVKTYGLTKDGTEHVTHFFGPGDFFSMTWLFRGHPSNVYYETLEPVSLWIVNRDDLLAFVMRDKQSTLELLEVMAERYLRYAGRIDNLLYSDARERCAYRLLSLGNRFGEHTADGLVINANITHEDMAHSLNMTRETFGRSLSRLQKRGIISSDDQRHVIIKDLPALAKIIGYDEVETQWPELMKYIKMT